MEIFPTMSELWSLLMYWSVLMHSELLTFPLLLCARLYISYKLTWDTFIGTRSHSLWMQSVLRS